MSEDRNVERHGSHRSGPLAGIRVLDLTSVMMGPYCTQAFCDMGAEVIKVEAPEGDSSRTIPPYKESGTGGIFTSLNRGKRCIVLDLQKAAGRDACVDLARTCDVFIHSMRPQAIERLGLNYENIAEANPSIVYCNLLGFGRDGRYSGLAAYDDAIQAACGLASLQEELIGRAAYIPTVLADKVTGMTAMYAVLAALLNKERTGAGQEIDVPMFETMASFVLVEHLCGAAFDPPLSRPVYPRVMARSRTPFATLDGQLSVLVYNNKQWVNFARLAGREDLVEDERFRTLPDRSRNLDAWNAAVAEVIATRTTAEWLAVLAPAGVPAMKVNTTEELFSDPHLQDVGFFRTLDHPVDGTLRLPGFPVTFSRTPAGFDYSARQQGEDTTDVLREAGFSQERIDQLGDAGILANRTSAPRANGQRDRVAI
jgi:crotonobetainyl-CoA:carnitine CoA-transferase CaiB-like acyl-CoA transferase